MTRGFVGEFVKIAMRSGRRFSNIVYCGECVLGKILHITFSSLILTDMYGISHGIV